MSPSHKQRIVGAAVLVALLLIIVPTILDFSRNERNDMKGMEIPPGPETRQMEVLPLDEWSKRVEPGVAAPQQPAAASEEAPAAESSAAPETETGPALVEPPVQPKSEAPAPAPTPPSAPAPVAKSAPAAPAPKAETAVVSGGWVVQVASLTVEAKAIELRDKLRKAGHSAAIERAKGSDGPIYRVKAGPVASRAEADTLKKKVKGITGLEGLVRQNR